jgi:hypothetical protein
MATVTHDARWRGAQAPPEQSSLDEPEEGRFDSWYSGLASFVFHFCLVMFVAMLSSIVVQHENLPVAVETVAVADTTATMGDSDDELPAGDVAESMAMAEDSSEVPVPEEATPEISQVEPVVVQEVLPNAADQQEIVDQQIAQSRAQAASARAAATKTLNKNLGGTPGSPSGGGGGSGRAGRAARWILRFNRSSTENFLEQLGGLGADIAFPQRGDTYLYFSDLTGSRRSSTKNLSDENRIFWIDDSRQSFEDVARTLGVNSPPFMCAFLPTPLEEKMLKLELAYKGAPNEESIVQTVFECVQRGGGYDVIVVDQTLVNE